MISPEQYAELNVGDTVTARYQSPSDAYELTSKVYVSAGAKCLAGKYLWPGAGGVYWTIIEHIPALPTWRSAHVISAEVDGEDGRFLFVARVNWDTCPWYSPALRDSFPSSALSDVKILVDKDVEL